MKARKGEAQSFFDENLQLVQDCCTEWPFRCNPKGYGTIMVKGKFWLVHRLAYTQVCGDIPPELLVCHRCDNRKCFNPSHLFLGTDLDNCRDRVAKGRSVILTGFDHPRSSVTHDDIIKVLQHESPSIRLVASETGIDPNIVKNILYGKSWVAQSIEFYRKSGKPPRAAWLRLHAHKLLG